jgi:hypothetical protein
VGVTVKSIFSGRIFNGVPEAAARRCLKKQIALLQCFRIIAGAEKYNKRRDQCGRCNSLIACNYLSVYS